MANSTQGPWEEKEEEEEEEEEEKTPLLEPGPFQHQTGNKRDSVNTRSKTIVLTEAGRAPWYDASGNPSDAYIVGIAGGSASGKTSVARAIMKSLPNVPWLAIVSQDAFYKSLTKAQSEMAFQDKYDFDHPDAFDHELLKRCIRDLKRSKAVEIPVYSFVEHQRTSEKTYLYGPSVLVVEGIFVLHDPEIRDLLDLKIFVQADSDLMLARRIRRDILERGRSVSSVIDQYLRYVKPAFDAHVSTTAKYADMIVPGANNNVAIEVISQHMEKQLRSRARKLRLELSKTPCSSSFEKLGPIDKVGGGEIRQQPTSPDHQHGDDERVTAGGGGGRRRVSITTSKGVDCAVGGGVGLPPNVVLLDQTTQLRGLLTVLHNETTPTGEFTFACKRVGTLVVEGAMALLPYRRKSVKLHTGGEYVGTELAADPICSVSILRSGSVLEPSVRRAFPAIPQGSLLIQSSEEDGEPHLYSVDLPSFIKRRSTAQKSWVLLLDAQIGTGAAALMAIRVLLDHSVPEEQIIFLTLLASAKAGLHALHRAFPKVRIVVAGVDPGLEKLRIPILGKNQPTKPYDSQGGGSGDGDHRPRRTGGSSASQAAGDARYGPSSSLSSSSSSFSSPSSSSPSSSTSSTEAQRRTSSPSSSSHSRVVFAITPGCGSIGDRFWGTTSR
ncbi:uridine kinase [Violaceomyces palustris]|uniref:Uridine kinase n=1 Tax=Violaceomyces palustris TaxID=1673888 RepID=A0ACD0NTW1_9BASI|nr:uridine kinase [Violaceomyces palustris]